MEKKYFKYKIPENTQCVECKEYDTKKIRFYWKCSKCDDYILCDKCYVSKIGYLSHTNFHERNEVNYNGRCDDNSSEESLTYMMSFLNGRDGYGYNDYF